MDRGERGSLFAGFTFTSLLTFTLRLLFGKVLRTFFRGGDTGDDVAKRVFQNSDGSYGGRTIAVLLVATQAEEGYRVHD